MLKGSVVGDILHTLSPSNYSDKSPILQCPEFYPSKRQMESCGLLLCKYRPPSLGGWGWGCGYVVASYHAKSIELFMP